MNFNIQEENEYVQTADTDSIIVSFEPILKEQYPDLDLTDKESIIPKTKILQQEIGEILNNYQSVIATDILNCKDHFFDLKPEFIFQSAYFSGKRRYAQFQVDKEGIPIEKMVVMGLDIMKSNFPEYFRGFGEQIIKKILFLTPKKEIDKFIIDFRDSINGVSWKKLTKPSGIKKIGEYISSPPPKGKIFSTLGKKCPINTKSSIRFNDLIKYNDWDVKYTPIQIGDKVYIIYLKKNPYRIDSLAIKSDTNPPEILEFVEQYIDRDKLFETIIQSKIDKIYEDLKYGKPVYNSIISEFFSFV